MDVLLTPTVFPLAFYLHNATPAFFALKPMCPSSTFSRPATPVPFQVPPLNGARQLQPRHTSWVGLYLFPLFVFFPTSWCYFLALQIFVCVTRLSPHVTPWRPCYSLRLLFRRMTLPVCPCRMAGSAPQVWASSLSFFTATGTRVSHISVS